MKERCTPPNRWINIMKWTVILVGTVTFFSSLSFAHSGSAQNVLNEKIVINLNNVSLKKALTRIESKVNVRFVYSSNIPWQQEVSVRSKESTLGKLLYTLLTPLQLEYAIIDDHIVIKRTKDHKSGSGVKASNELNTEFLTTLEEEELENFVEIIIPEVLIKGSVMDENNQPLPGVNIIEKGTTNGTTTDVSGVFSISVDNSNSVLVFSSIGYATQEITVGERSNITVNLVPDVKSLNEVVIVGYGSQEKRDITGSVSSISSKDLRQVPVVTLDQALQGRMAGVQVQQTSGAPGGAIQIRVRGVNSTAGGGANQPLYVVDGIPLVWNEGANSISVGNEGSTGGAGSNGSSPLAGINPNDIESIEVLKDASASAIYGSRAANGVVLITTKTGKAGKTAITFDSYYGVQTLREKIPMTNARERMSFIFEHRRNAGTRGNDIFDTWAVNPYLYNYDGTDWQDELFRSAKMQNYSVAATGGTENLRFATSLDYLDQQGIVINTGAKRYSARVNLDAKASEKLSMGIRTSFSFQSDKRVDTDEFFQSQLAYPTSPLSPVLDANGNYTGRPNNIINGNFAHEGGGNPVANIMERDRISDRYRFLTNLYAEYHFSKSLSFKTVLGIDYLSTELTSNDPIWRRNIDSNTNQRLTISQPRSFNWLTEQLLTFNKEFDKHGVNVVAGYSVQQFSERFLFVIGQGSPTNALDQMGNMQSYVGQPSGGRVDNALVSQFIRANYDFDGRYLFTGTVRRDGSSRFGSDNRYGVFPSASFGWRISEEKFIKNLVSIPDMKFRVSYGSLGNQNIGNFLFLPLMSGANSVWGNSVVNGVAPTRFENTNIKWETTTQFDIGMDVSLLRGRINLTADYYDKRTVGLLGPAPLSVISGVGNTFTTNVGNISNKGIELGVNATIIDNGNVRWTTNFNIATNKNRVEKLGLPFINGANIARINSNINRTEEGQPIGGFWVVRESGQYQSWEEAATAPVMQIGGNQPYFAPGDFKPVDKNSDGFINDEDREWVGSPFPDFFGGISTSVSYKGFTLDILGNFQYGNLLWNQPRLNSETFEQNVWREHYDNRWLPSSPGQVTSVPVPRNNNPLLVSDRFLEDASFFRVRTITLGYDLPSSTVSKIKLNGVRFYIQANNYLTFTKYSGWDPEVNSFGSSVTTNGIDIGAYPIAKSILGGMNLRF